MRKAVEAKLEFSVSDLIEFLDYNDMADGITAKVMLKVASLSAIVVTEDYNLKRAKRIPVNR